MGRKGNWFDAMKTILITGASGFVGRNLRVTLEAGGNMRILACDVDTVQADLFRDLEQADVVIHLAGVNRPQSEREFEEGNVGFTDLICRHLESVRRKPVIIFASSIQAILENPYGRSKRAAEERLERYAACTGAVVTIFRFTNIFGKWCRPNYNSVVATFCHNVAHGLPLAISDPARELELVYIDDVVKALVEKSMVDDSCYNNRETGGVEARVVVGVRAGAEEKLPAVSYAEVSPVYQVTLGVLADTIMSFRETRRSLLLPNVGDGLIYALYSTYLTYLEPQEFGYALEMKHDARGELAEFIRMRNAGQIFVSTTKPGVVRGNHFHHTKTEKFLVLTGEAVIRLRSLINGSVSEYRVTGGRWTVVDIPPGYSHSIENVGKTELVTLFWSSEPFDPQKPDTYQDKVISLPESVPLRTAATTLEGRAPGE